MSADGLHFKKTRKLPEITIPKQTERENTLLCSDFRISFLDGQYVALYKKRTEKGIDMNIAFSTDAIRWKKPAAQLSGLKHTAMVLPKFTDRKGIHLALTGQTELYITSSHDLLTWETDHTPILQPRHSYFDNHPLALGGIHIVKQGYLAVYFSIRKQREGNVLTAGLALFDRRNPRRLIWRSTKPLWEQGSLWQHNQVYPLGTAMVGKRLIVYVGMVHEAVQAIVFEDYTEFLEGRALHEGPTLQKHHKNPIITPVLKHAWEASSTFNAAALYDEGKVHILYRAMGPHNTSVIGYAASKDGIHIDERLPEPIYVPTQEFEYPGKNPSICFMSGGGYGGCEDPRITRIDDTLYMTYVAYNGHDHPRVALTSIEIEDFRQKHWDKWARPKLISRPGVVNKNCVIFPEKVNGKYVVIHRVFPNLLIDFVEDLTFENRYLEGQHKIPPREDAWDSRKLGAGAPPIKTKDGWLLIYQAVDDRDPGKYKIGAMLLDLNDPTKVLSRSHTPVLEPTEWYENEGFKAGVAYPCGAVVMHDKLMVYYGGADTVICAASERLDTFLENLKKSSPVRTPAFAQAQSVVYDYN